MMSWMVTAFLVVAGLVAWTGGTAAADLTSLGGTLSDPLDDIPDDILDGTGKPTRLNTGVSPTAILTPHIGDIVVTRPGTVIANREVFGFITVKAPNVTIRNTVVHGGPTSYNRGLITNYGYDNLLVENVDVIPLNDTVWQDGVKGWDFTLRRVYINGNVDSVKIHGDNVLIRDSVLEDTNYQESDPNQDGRPSHNDGVQILKGRNIRIVNNTIRDQQNFAVLGSADKGNTSGLQVRNNYLDGGQCTVKLEEKNGRQLSVAITDNKLGPNRTKPRCKINGVRGITVTASGNKMLKTGEAVGILWTSR